MHAAEQEWPDVAHRRQTWFDGQPGDALLDGDVLYSLKEARVLIERWRHRYNTDRPHSALGYRSPAPQASALERTDPAVGSWMGYSRIGPSQKSRQDEHSDWYKRAVTLIGFRVEWQ